MEPSPSFREDLNNTCQQMDFQKLRTLGPMAKALYEVLRLGQFSDKYRLDSKITGDQLRNNNQLGYLAGSFLLFRGALMT